MQVVATLERKLNVKYQQRHLSGGVTHFSGKRVERYRADGIQSSILVGDDLHLDISINVGHHRDRGPYIPENHVNGYVKMQVVARPHSRFTRKGDDFHHVMPVILSGALVGVNRTVKQLYGRLVQIRADKVSKPADQTVIEGEEMSSFKGDEPADMVVAIAINWFFFRKIDFLKNKAVERNKPKTVCC